MSILRIYVLVCTVFPRLGPFPGGGGGESRILRTRILFRSRRGKPNQEKAKAKSSYEFRVHFLVISGVFFLRKTSTIFTYIELLFRNAPAKSSHELTFLWFGLARGRKNNNKHKTTSRDCPGNGWGVKVFMCFPFSRGKKETHKQNSQEISGKGRERAGRVSG